MTNLIPCVEVVNEKIVVSSLKVAEHFNKRHDNILRSLVNIVAECDVLFTQLNFEERNYIDERGKEQPCYNLSRDGFTLLAMGFTGKKALEWKIKYIEAFNKMEAALKTTPTALTASTPADRKPLRDILHVWTQQSNLLHSQAWKMVAAHFELETATQLPVEWLADAIAFVQAKIDALPVAQPQPQLQQTMQLELIADSATSKFTPYMYAETKEKLIKLERDLSSLHANLNIYCRCGGMDANDFSRNREFIKIIEASVNTLQDNVRAAISQVQVTKKVFSLMQ